jgi:hypothetical protein
MVVSFMKLSVPQTTAEKKSWDQYRKKKKNVPYGTQCPKYA